MPSCTVTMILIVFAPTFKGIAADAVPDATVVPFTFSVAFGSVVVGVTVTDVTVLVTLTV